MMNEMRKLIETIEKLNESDPTAGGRMQALYADLSEVIKNSDSLQTDLEKYPQLDEYRRVTTEVYMTCHRLRQLIDDVLK